MQEQYITCPNCGEKINLSEVITREIKDSLFKELEPDILKSQQLAVKRATENFELEKKSLEEALKEKERKLRESQEAELGLRKKQREIEDKEKSLDLEIARKVDVQTKTIRESVQKSLADEYRLRELDKEKLITDMKEQIEDLKRKAEQGSQQTQGEVMELELEDILRAAFPYDLIEPVPKGIKGADVIQKVNNQMGQSCGTIIWESKRTKAWSDGWLTKLKDDQRESKAEISALVSTVLPKDISNIALIDGVWVTNFETLQGLATALRLNLIQLQNSKTVAVGKGEKMEVLYNYLTSIQFKQKVEAIVEAFTTMKNDLEQEKRAIQKNWAKREKQIDKVINNTVGMYGEMQGIMGASLPEIKSMELKALTEGDEEEEIIE